jgi:2-succinyl-6-hydroxy-2,4-cyclohexadiene-1-carboxylate synthase
VSAAGGGGGRAATPAGGTNGTNGTNGAPAPGALPGLSHPAKGAGGPSLVLLHGFLGAPSAWDAVLAALPRHGPVWCPWLPGHGPLREALPASWDEAVRSFAASLPAGAMLAGYSLGARLALAATLHRPGRARATLLVGGHVGPLDDAERAARAALDAQRAADLRHGNLAAFVAAWEALPLFATQHALTPELQARQRALRLAHDAQALTWAFEVAGLAQMPDLRAAVAAARQPLHFLAGALDTRFAALAATLARPPWVTQASVPAAGHNLLLEAPGAVAASLNDLMEM